MLGGRGAKRLGARATAERGNRVARFVVIVLSFVRVIRTGSRDEAGAVAQTKELSPLARTAPLHGLDGTRGSHGLVEVSNRAITTTTTATATTRSLGRD